MLAPRIFDGALQRRRLDRALAAGPADFLLARAADDLADRLALVKRDFATAVDIGTPGPHAAAALRATTVLRLAPTLASLGRGPFAGAVGDPERSPLGENAFDLIVSLLALHQVDDLPGALIQMRRALKPDGLFIAALPGGDTLSELRECLLVAESETTGGASPRVAPLADARALGGLLQRAGFARLRGDQRLDRPLAAVCSPRAFRPSGLALRRALRRSRRTLARDVRNPLAFGMGAASQPTAAAKAGVGEDAARGCGETKSGLSALKACLSQAIVGAS